MACWSLRPDHFANGALADFAQRGLRIAHLEQIVLGVPDAVLHGDLQLDHVRFGGEHARLVVRWI